MNTKALDAVALSIRSLSMDAIEAAKSGHPGLPMGMAEFGALLFGEILTHNPQDPAWMNRDRFVLSAGHGSMFLYSLLHLSGYDLPLSEVKRFRQVGSLTPGHPEFGHTAGVETTTGPLGQGLANAVGFALGERHLAARLNTPEFPVIDHYTYVLAGDGCMMEGLTSEAASFAGHQGLGKLIVFYDSNRISIEGSTDLAFTEDVAGRYRAFGWQVLEVSAYDYQGMRDAVHQAKSQDSQPSLIILTSTIGKGAPTKAGTAGIHGAPLGAEELSATKKALGIPEDHPFFIHPEALAYFKEKASGWAQAQNAWNIQLAAWKKAHPENAALLEQLGKRGPELLDQVEWPAYKPGDTGATRSTSGKALNALAKVYPGIIGGSADLAPSNNTNLQGFPDMDGSNPGGRNLHFGVREHAMGAISNGLALYGNLRPFCATFLVFTDYMRPAMRLAALMKLPVIYIMTHDSIFVGEDGPTHQPVEHLAVARAIPNMVVLRPGDGDESNLAWIMAMERTNGPVVLSLTRQNLPVYEKPAGWEQDALRGAYILYRGSDNPDICLVATGSEVHIALDAAKRYESANPGKTVRVVSMISRELFLSQDKTWRRAAVPPKSRVMVVEIASSLGWEGFVQDRADLFTLDSFGISGPGSEVAEHFGLDVHSLIRRMEGLS